MRPADRLAEAVERLLARCANAIKAIPKTECYPLSYQERLLVARTVLREAGVIE